MCGNCITGVAGILDDGPVFCTDCPEGVQLELERLQRDVGQYERALARYDGTEDGWQRAYRDRLRAARSACVRRARDLQALIEGLQVRALD